MPRTRGVPGDDGNSMPVRPRFLLIRDSREQQPLDRHFSEDVVVIVETMPEGDYTTPPLRGIAAIERKSVADLVASLTWQRERFKRELERLRSYAFKAIVIEGSMAEITAGAYRSKAHPNSIVGSLCALFVDYDCPVVFADTPKGAATIVEKLLRRVQAKLGAKAVA